MKKIILSLSVMLIALTAAGESKSFKLAKWTEINTAILKELNRSYVDTLPLDRIEKIGIDSMLSNLDPYTIYVPSEDNKDFEMMINNSYGGIGAIIFKPEKNGNVVITEPYENSPAHKAGLVCGDEIITIDSQSTHGLNASQCSSRMKGEPGTEVVFKVKKLRSGDSLDVKIVREKIHIPDVQCAVMIEDKVGYICLTGFTEGVSGIVRSETARLKKEGMRMLVLDLRGNGGGLMSEAIDIVSAFVPKGSLVVTAKSRASKREYKTALEPIDLKLPVIVMVDNGSASASEIVAGALQDLDRAVIMGRRTFGKGLVQGISPLPYGGQLKFTTAKYYTPSGRCVQAIDYSHRAQDGKVGHIPDSLTKAFKTSHGRIVRDGGGITPDVKLDTVRYSRLTYSLVWNGVLDHYALEFVRKHESIPTPEEFHFSDADYEDFIEFAKTQTFDYRSSARTYVDLMRSEIRKDGLSESVGEKLKALESALEMSKEDFLRLKKREIIPFIEKEIVVRYYFQKSEYIINLRYDKAIEQAIKAYKPDILK